METVESPLSVRSSAPVLAVLPGGATGSVDDLGSQIVALAGRLAAATCRWLLLVAQFDARDGCARFGMASTARWLGYSCALSRRTAVEHVRVARALESWPQLAAEMSAGRLSYSHVRAISRVAADGTAAMVDDLINLAVNGTAAQVESTVRGLRTVRDGYEPDARPVECVSSSWTDRNQWRLSARLDPERGALVESAVKQIAQTEKLSVADALVRLAEIGLAALADEGRPRTLRGDEQAAIVVHLDASRVPAESAEPTEATEAVAPRSAERGRPFARIADGPGLPVEVVERLACSGRIRTAVIDKNGGRSNVLDLGRSRRLVSDRQYRALLLRDGHCAHPGCRSPHALEAHHVRHWLHGGKTDMDNLVLLCKAHHLAHHDGEFSMMALRQGRFRFYRDGRELPVHVDPSGLIDRDDHVEDEHNDIAPDAATPRWDGSRLDRELAVWGIAQNLRRPA